MMTTQNLDTKSGSLSTDDKERYWKYCDDHTVTAEIAAQLLGRKSATLKKWRADKVGPRHIRGKPPMYSMGDLRAYNEDMKSSP